MPLDIAISDWYPYCYGLSMCNPAPNLHNGGLIPNVIALGVALYRVIRLNGHKGGTLIRTRITPEVSLSKSLHLKPGRALTLNQILPEL